MKDKIKAIAKTISKDIAKNVLCAKVKENLDKTLKASYIRGLISFSLYMVAILLLLLDSTVARIISSSIIIAVYIYSLIRIFQTLSNTIPIAISIIKMKSIKYGILNYYCNRRYAPYFALADSVASLFHFKLNSRKELLDIADEVYPYLYKTVLSILLKIAGFSLGLFVLRRTLLYFVADVSILQMIAYPVAIAIDFLFKTSLVEAIGL